VLWDIAKGDAEPLYARLLAFFLRFPVGSQILFVEPAAGRGTDERCVLVKGSGKRFQYTSTSVDVCYARRAAAAHVAF